jgi:SAM-dependent methyltransferase
MCHSLEHVPDPDTTIRGVARLLRPGGRLHVAVPNGEAAALAVQGRRWMHLSHPLHFWFFDRSSLTALLERHRLRVDSAWTTSRWHHLSAWAHRVTAGDGAAASRELAQIARRSSASRWTGDVLRVAATRVA